MQFITLFSQLKSRQALFFVDLLLLLDLIMFSFLYIRQSALTPVSIFVRMKVRNNKAAGCLCMCDCFPALGVPMRESSVMVPGWTFGLCRNLSQVKQVIGMGLPVPHPINNSIRHFYLSHLQSICLVLPDS